MLSCSCGFLSRSTTLCGVFHSAVSISERYWTRAIHDRQQPGVATRIPVSACCGCGLL
jgi:hypothetical protein